MNEWINVKTRLPETNKDVLATDGESVVIAHNNHDSWYVAELYEVRDFDNVTHWMELPELPKED